MGATVKEADSVKSGLMAIAESPPDLLLCDLLLPDRRGMELIERLHLERCRFPVLVLSSTEEINDIAQAMRLGVYDLLLKPMESMEQL
ncbi:response regulator, partial [Leucobacter sp. M11]|uniref:response regulator n=1 Tax=Leucobacter sp. M11 TaxID=2993565 RepID=UPI002D80DFEC